MSAPPDPERDWVRRAHTLDLCPTLTQAPSIRFDSLVRVPATRMETDFPSLMFTRLPRREGTEVLAPCSCSSDAKAP